MAQHGPVMIKYTWEAVSQLWHPDMKNMAGPWDRAYGYDMQRYVSLMALWMWVLIGKEKSSLLPNVWTPRHLEMVHTDIGNSLKSCRTPKTTRLLPASLF